MTLTLCYDIITSLPYTTSKIDDRLFHFQNAFNSNLTINSLAHITLLHGLFPDYIFPYTYTIMGQSWSLTLEWQFYLFIPIIYSAVYFKNKKAQIASLAMCGLIVVSYVVMSQASFLSNMLIYFLIGFFSYPLYKKHIENNSYSLHICIGVLTILIMLYNYQYAIIIILWGATLILQSKRYYISDLIFSNKVIQWIGKISYSIYCTHMLVIYFVLYFLIDLSLVSTPFFSEITIILSLLLTLIVSQLTYKYCKKPAANFAKK